MKKDSFWYKCLLIVRGWIVDLGQEVSSSTGWRLIAKVLAVFAGAYGLLVTLLTLLFQVNISQTESAERSYLQLVTDFGSASESVRIGAITRVPAIMSRQVPLSERAYLSDALRLSFGLERHQTATPFCSDLRRLLHLYMNRIRLPGVADQSENVVSLSRAELAAIVDMLVTLGPQGWQEGRIIANQPVTHRETGLSWVWNEHGSPSSDKYSAASSLFERTALNNPDFQRFQMPECNFNGSRLDGALFSYCRLNRASFQDASFDRPEFLQALLSDANFARSSFTKANFGNAILVRADFRNCKLIGASFHDTKLNGARFFNALMRGANFSNADASRSSNAEGESLPGAVFLNADLSEAKLANAKLQGSVFERTTLDRAHFENAILDNANLSYASARDADFSFASLRGVSFALTDLSQSRFANAKSLLEVKSWRNANIANIVGVSSEVIKQILSAGAVAIPDLTQWEKYKEAGCPHEKWPEFSRNPDAGARSP